MSERPGFLAAASVAFASRYADTARGPRGVSETDRSAPSRHQPNLQNSDDARGASAARGEGADTPAEIPARGWKAIAARVWSEIGEDRVIAVAAGVTFYGLLAIFPMITALVSLYGFVADPVTINEHLKSMTAMLPGGAVDVIGEQVKRISEQPRGQLGFGFIAGLAVTLWSANAGVKAIFDALNVAYGEQEKRSFLWLNLQSMMFTLLGLVSAILVMLTVVVLPTLLAWIAPGGAMQTIFSYARWPLLVIGLIAALAVLYRYGPSREEPQWVWLSPGAIVAAIVWLAASLAFSYYAKNFGSYNETYGSLGAVIGFMTWIWISVAIILVGAVINAEAERQASENGDKGDRKQKKQSDGPAEVKPSKR